eukprot:gene5689-6390_t
MAAKMDSRGGTKPTKVTFNRPSNQSSGSTAGQSNDTNHEMHIKMSKKIAQLTKVIYSLNSKNDEHEEIFESLKNAHEEELQKVAIESKEKIGHYKQKMELFKEQESLISRLQSLLEDERQEKQKFIEDFDKFKIKKSGAETEITKKFESKLSDISSKLSVLKDEYENRTQKFQSVTKNLENEKERMVSELSHKHSVEMDNLIKAHRVRYDELKNKNEALETSIESLKSNDSLEVSRKITEIKNLEKEHEAKSSKLKSFYENELEAAKRQHEQILLEMEEKLNKEAKLSENSAKRREEELRNRIRGLTENNELLENQMEELTLSLDNLKAELNNTVHNKEGYSREVSSLKQNLSTKETWLETMQNELDALKSRFDLQSKELLKKSAELGSLEALKISYIGTINELNAEVARLSGKCNELEAERKNLGYKLSENSTEAEQQMQNLQRDLNKALEEQKATIAKYEAMLTKMHEEHHRAMQELFNTRDNDVSILVEKHSSELANLRVSYENDIEELQTRITDEKTVEIERLREQNETALRNKMDEITKLTESCSDASKEIERLNELLNDQKLSRESTSVVVNSLEGRISEFNSQLKEAERELAKSQQEVKKLQNEAVSKQNEHSKMLEKSAGDLKRKLRDLQTELDSQWSSKLKSECENLRSELRRKHNEENEATMTHIVAMKDGEIEAYKTELQQQIVKYQQLIKELRSTIESNRAEFEKATKRNASEFDSQRRKYEEDIARLKFQHSGEVENLYLENERNLKALSTKYDLNLKEAEDKLKAEHNEQISAIMLANRAAIDSVREEARQTKEKELQDLHATHAEEKETLRHTMHVQHQDDIEQINQEFEEELQLTKEELQKIKDLRLKEFEIHAAKIEELNNAGGQKDCRIVELEKGLEKVQENVKALNKELESKVEDIRKARREGHLNLRRREQQLAKEHQNEVDSLTAEHLRETQRLLTEFNKAKELLKDKIEALQILLEQAEESYRNRESRPEDLEEINQLKRTITEREIECRKLVDEKRYFQMELLNRETNFNKIFNNIPSVGVINPLESGKKKRKDGKKPWNSAGSRRSNGGAPASGTSSPARLDPLPHPQIHEQRLNNSKPLPNAPIQGN